MKKLETNYDFTNVEKEIREYWEKDDTFKKLVKQNENGPKYRFIDGPITANNSMKIHHVWGRTLKDAFLRYKAMNGYTTHYRNGFDSQGLWVEVEVEKELGFKSKKDIEEYGLDKFTLACKNRVKNYSKAIVEQSKTLGQWMDWDNSYFTYTDENITGIWAFLKKCHENNWIKESYKPLPWCIRCGTSLSEHEMTGSYHDVTHTAVFFKLPIKDKNTNILVWTTTPWTLSANTALAINKDLTYVKVQMNEEKLPLIMCKDVFTRKFEKNGGEILEEFKGSTLEGLEYETCFPELKEQIKVKHRIVLWDNVDSTEGSGVVHIAPGCGSEDFELGESIGLDIITPIDENGLFYPDFGFLAGKNAQEVNDLVFDELKKRDKMYLTHPITHSYPFCWRCKQDIVFRLDKGWAIDVEELRPRLIKNARTVKWYPEYQGKRMEDWLTNMGNWNISRKRYYGLPLPFYKCTKCGHLSVIGSKEELIELSCDKNISTNIKELHRPWIDEVKIKCPVCGEEVSRTPEVGDVWLDAGIVPFSTLKYFTDKEYWNSYFPAEYVVEMHEQVRLWFYAMLFMSTVLVDKAPYEAVGTHGMVTGEDGTKFSKTGFNISFEEAVGIIGVDATRYLYASANPVNNVRFGYNLGDDAKRKLLSYYNMVVFFETYADLDKPDLVNFVLDEKYLTISDKWLLKITNKFINDSTNNMNNYNTGDVCSSFEKFCDDVSNFYIRINRRRFWKSENGQDKLTAYYCLFNAIKTLTQVMAPIIPFMSEYIWMNIIRKYDNTTPTSVHLSSWPKQIKEFIDDSIIEDTSKCRDIITLALKLRNESSIKVRQPLKELYILNNDSNKAVNEYTDIIKSEINVKDIILLDSFDKLKDEYLSLNFKESGSALKQDVNKVKELLTKVQSNKELISKVHNNETIKIDGYDQGLEAKLFNIETIEKESIKISTEGSATIALNILVDEELKKDGICRDIIRQCQVFRKEAGFNVENRIYIKFETDNEYIKDILSSNKDLINNELLSREEPRDTYEYSSTIEDSEYKLKVYLERI
ncbi:MAG: isoleucine--tRNA ligase [Bacilli bacterium]